MLTCKITGNPRSRPPFRTAVPVLAGWDIGYECRDDDVQELGVWIEGFEYERSPFPHDPTGTLRYRISRVLRDKSDSEQHRFEHSVDILGIGQIFTKLAPGGVIVPIEP